MTLFYSFTKDSIQTGIERIVNTTFKLLRAQGISEKEWDGDKIQIKNQFPSWVQKEYANNPTIDLLVSVRDVYISISSNGVIGDVDKLLLALRKIKDQNPLALGKLLKSLRKSNPKTVARFEEEFGKEEAEAITKGSSILNRFGI